jgi:hypothetical protein
MKVFVKTILIFVSNSIKSFWIWLKSIYDEVKKIFVAIVSVFKDPFNKVSMGRIIIVGLVIFGGYLAIKNAFAIMWAVIIIAIACLTYVIMKYIERKFK